MDALNQMMAGGVAMAFFVAAVVFLRFWQKAGDRLFLLFSISFVVLAANRIAGGIATVQGHEEHSVYWIRFAAFAVILVAILDKNWSAKRS
jgi:hypothetical protein